MKNVIFSSLLILVFSCTEPEPVDIISDYMIFNNSGVNVTFNIYSSNLPVALHILNGETYSKSISAEGVIGARLFVCDSLEMIFNSDKKVMYKWLNTSLRNPLLLESYEKTKIGDYHYEFRYTITAQDYIDAGK